MYSLLLLLLTCNEKKVYIIREYICVWQCMYMYMPVCVYMCGMYVYDSVNNTKMWLVK